MKALAVLALLAAACTPPPPTATAADAQRAGVALAELQDGRRLMIAKCSACHAPPQPKDETIAGWPKQLDDMGARAKLDAQERHLIEQYFIVMASR